MNKFIQVYKNINGTILLISHARRHNEPKMRLSNQAATKQRIGRKVHLLGYIQFGTHGSRMEQDAGAGIYGEIWTKFHLGQSIPGGGNSQTVLC